MKRYLPLVFGLLLIAALTVHDFYDFFVTNEGIDYFASEPRRLLYVAFISLLAGAIAITISRLSSNKQRKLKLIVLGFAGSVLPVFLFSVVFVTVKATSGIDDPIPNSWIVIITVSAIAIAGVMWFEFFQLLRQKVSKDERR